MARRCREARRESPHRWRLRPRRRDRRPPMRRPTAPRRFAPRGAVAAAREPAPSLPAPARSESERCRRRPIPSANREAARARTRDRDESQDVAALRRSPSRAAARRPPAAALLRRRWRRGARSSAGAVRTHRSPVRPSPEAAPPARLTARTGRLPLRRPRCRRNGTRGEKSCE